MQVEEQTTTQSLEAKGGQIIEALKELVHEGNIRKVTIRQDGRTLAEFPLTFGVVGAAVAPVWAAIGAIAALANDCTIEVERADMPDGDAH